MDNNPKKDPESSSGGRVNLLAPLDRFNGFSDAVFAIAITLLVLELPVPPVSVELVPALMAQWPVFLGYFISFAYIGSTWLTHAELTRLMKRGDAIVYGMNLLLLLLVALIPFSTNVMVTHLTGPDVETAVLLYGINIFFASLTLSLLILNITRDSSLLSDDIADQTLQRLFRRRWFSIGINLVGLVLALWAPLAAVGLYLIQTFMLLAFPLLGMHRHLDNA